MKLSFSALLLAPTAALLLAAPPSFSLENDGRIELGLKGSYNYKTFLAADPLEVKCKAGIVTLSGFVSDDFHKTLAAETAADFPGVTQVDNRLEIKGEQPPEQSDAWISAKVKTALLLHSHQSGADTEVMTKDGVVTLKGLASSPAEKDRVAECAKDILGVKDLKNEMTIASAASPRPPMAMGAEVDDASVTAQVRASLLIHRSTHLLAAKVKTQGGAVTLSGVAQDPGEKAMVTKLVNEIQGVKTVNNRMIIARPVS